MSYVDAWRAGGVFGTTRAPARRTAEDRNDTTGLGPMIEGGVLPGTVIENPENLPVPRPEKMVRCVVLTPFCVGARPDGTVHDAWVGDVLELPARRANRLARMQTVEIVPDEIDLRAKASMARAERADRLAQAARLAAPPPPVPTAGRRDDYGRVIEEAPREKMTLRALRSFSLGNGRDVVAGEVFECDEESALYRVTRGLAVAVEDTPSAEKEPADSTAPITKRGRVPA